MLQIVSISGNVGGQITEIKEGAYCRGGQFNDLKLEDS